MRKLYNNMPEKKQKNGSDPNGRSYDRKFEEKLKRMNPEEIQALLDDD